MGSIFEELHNMFQGGGGSRSGMGSGFGFSSDFFGGGRGQGRKGSSSFFTQTYIQEMRISFMV